MLETVCSLLDTIVGARRNAILSDFLPVIIYIINLSISLHACYQASPVVPVATLYYNTMKYNGKKIMYSRN